MKRRDFVKAFVGVGAAVPVATTLANVSGVEKVIETFTKADMENELLKPYISADDPTFKIGFIEKDGNIKYIGEGKNLNIDHHLDAASYHKYLGQDYLKEVDKLEPCSISINNNNIEIDGRRFSPKILGYNRDQAMEEVHRYLKNSGNKDVIVSDCTFVSKYDYLLGVKRYSNIIGTWEYWRNPNHNRIMKEVYLRQLTIMSIDKYFKYGAFN